jgi:hypothetical protein
MKILLASYGAGHVDMLIPVYKEFTKRGHSVVVIGFTMAMFKLQENDIPYLSYRSFLEKKDMDSLAIGESLVESMELNPKIPVAETIAYMGICYQELVCEYGIEKAAAMYKKMGRQCFLPRKFMSRVLNKIKPNLVLTTNSPRSEQALVLEARRKGIRCAILNGFYGERDSRDRMGHKGYGDKIFVSFRKTKEILLSLERKDEEVLVLGNPSLDRISEINVLNTEESFKKKPKLENKKILVWLKSIHPKTQTTELKIEKYLIEKFSGNETIQMIFRPHPNDTAKCDYGESVIVSNSSDPLYELLASSDLVLTINSRAGLEANLMGKAVTQIDLLDFPEKIPFSELGIGDTVYTLGCLRDSITKYLLRQKVTIRHKPCFKVGNITTRIVDCLEKECDIQI